jgi:hypothetical protein
MTTSPPQTEPRAEQQPEQPQSEPPALQSQQRAVGGEDTASYAWLFDSLTRAAATGPWWRRWWSAAVDVVQSSWEHAFAAVSAANRGPQRRWFTILAAGIVALALSTTGVIAAVQESWTPTRISAALKFDEPEPPAPDEPANAPAERPAAPLQNSAAQGDEHVAEPLDDAAVPVATRKRTKPQAEADNQPRSRRPRRDGDAAGSGDSQEREPEPDAEPAQAAPAGADAPAPQAATAPQPAPPRRDPTFGPGETMRAGDRRESTNGAYTLVMQPDGNLTAYRNGAGAVWSSRTAGNAGAYAVNQTDGNVVVYGPTKALWSTRTHGKSGTTLYMQDDGNVVARLPNGTPVWASGTAQ